VSRLLRPWSGQQAGIQDRCRAKQGGNGWDGCGFHVCCCVGWFAESEGESAVTPVARGALILAPSHGLHWEAAVEEQADHPSADSAGPVGCAGDQDGTLGSAVIDAMLRI